MTRRLDAAGIATHMPDDAASANRDELERVANDLGRG